MQRVVQDKQSLQKNYHDNCAKLRTFAPCQTVMARDYLSSKKWIPGVIETSSVPIKLRFTLGRLLLGILINSYQPILQMINCHLMIGLCSSTRKLPTPLLLPKTTKMKYLHPGTILDEFMKGILSINL